jgi:hypothetical protein
VREAISSRLNWKNDDFESGDLIYYIIYALHYTYGSSGPDAVDVWANALFSPLAKIARKILFPESVISDYR